MKDKLIKLIENMTDNQIIYAFTFLSRLFDTPEQKEKATDGNQ